MWFLSPQNGVEFENADSTTQSTMSVIPETKRQITAVTFWTEKDGIVVLDRGEEVYRYRIVPIAYTRQGMIAAMAP